MKRKLLFTLIFSLCFSTAFAWVNLALTAGELAAPFVISAGVKYLLPASSTSNLPSRGVSDNYNIRRNSLGIYGNIATSAAITIGTSLLIDYLANHQSQYPNLYNGSRKSTAVTGGDGSSTDNVLPNGTVVKDDDGLFYRTTNLVYDSFFSGSVPPSNIIMHATYDMQEALYVYHPSGEPYNPDGSIPCDRLRIYTVLPATDPGTVPMTPSEFAAYVNNNLANQALNNEIDALIQSAPNIVNFPNSEVMKNSDDYYKEKSMDAALANIAKLQAAFDAAKAAYLANPTDANKKLMDDAEKALNDAIIAYQNMKNQEKTADNAPPVEDPPIADPTLDTNVYDDSITAPEAKSLSTLLTQTISQSPMGSLIGSLGMTTSDPSPTMKLFDAYDQEFIADFSPYESTFNTAGAIVLGFAHIAAVFIVFRHRTEGES